MDNILTRSLMYRWRDTADKYRSLCRLLWCNKLMEQRAKRLLLEWIEYQSVCGCEVDEKITTAVKILRSISPVLTLNYKKLYRIVFYTLKLFHLNIGALGSKNISKKELNKMIKEMLQLLSSATLTN